MQLNFVYTLRVEVCDREKVRFYSELFFGDPWLLRQPQGQEVGGRGGSGKLLYEKVGNAVYLFHVSYTRQIKLTLCLGWSLKGVLFKCSDKNS